MMVFAETSATVESTPALVDELAGHHQGEGFGNGTTREEKDSYEWYDNFDGTYTLKKVIWIKTTKPDEENINTHRTVIETITKEEYFKRKLAATLYLNV